MKAIHLLIIGLVLMISGVILPLLMVIKILPSGFFLAFLSHAASVSGLFLGLIGAATYARDRK
jgi:hypothetical protein